jgi:2-oxoglutarate dehydrogenase E2 component (dihydrolipoamide succinyltransferase)
MLSIKVPQLGESIVEATISQWRKKEGDTVAAGETLVDLETDKVTVEVPSLKSGVLLKRLKQEGDVVTVNEELALLDDAAAGSVAQPPSAGSSYSATPSITSTTGAPSAPGPFSPNLPAPPSPGSGTTPAATSRVSPAAVRIAEEHGLDVSTVAGTGRGGVISKPDVIEHLASAGGGPTATHVAALADAHAPTNAAPANAPTATKPAASVPVAIPGALRETREKMSTRRKRIAEHLLEAQHATAHLTTFNEIDMSAVDALRARVKEKIEKEHGVRLSFMPFFVKAACMALKQFPVVNAKIEADHFVYHHYVNMGIAVASDAGLVVPNLKDADSMGLIDIGRAIADIAKKARDGKLTMDDLTGGTFTITNGGVFGSLLSTPIINYPQVGILGLHKTQDRPVVVGGQVVVRSMMYVALSYDHRIIDGQHAVLFLVKVKELMEDPALMAID